jgi:nicotinamidase/pyrazinamidase
MTVSKSGRENHAIIVVDPQPDFFEDGPLPIQGATKTAERIARYLRDRDTDYSMIIVTQDWHVEPNGHWSVDPDYVTSWPVHCVANTSGAEIHSALHNQRWDVVIRKGQHDGAYSGFAGMSDDGSTLTAVLSSAGVDTVAVVGFATDHCVKATALDARALGLTVNVLVDLCAGVDAQATSEAINEMAKAGVTIKNSGDV